MTKLANFQKLIIEKEWVAWIMLTPTNVLPYISSNIITKVENQRQKEVTGLIESQEIIKWKKIISWTVETNTSVSKIWHKLTGMFWEAVNVDNWDWTHTHTFNIENKDVKTYSIELEDSAISRRYTGVKFDNLSLKINDNHFTDTIDIYWTKSIEQEKIKEVDSVLKTVTLYEDVLFKPSDKVAIFNKKGIKIKSNLDVILVNWRTIELSSVTSISADHSIALEKRETWISNNEINKSLLSCQTEFYINEGVNEIKVSKVIDFNETIKRNIDENEDFYLGSCYREEITSKNLIIEGSINLSITSDQSNRLLANYKNWDLTKYKRIIKDSIWNSYTIEASMVIENIEINKQIWDSVEVSIKYSNVKTTKIELTDTITWY